MRTTITDAVIRTSSATQTCDRLFASIDAQDWNTFEQCLASTVTTDFTSLWGGAAEESTPSELRDAWATLFAAFRATQHLVNNYIVIDAGDDHVVLGAAFQATHFGNDPFGSPSWTLYGTYRIELTRQESGLKIRRLQQNPSAGEGNRNIVRLAAGA